MERGITSSTVGSLTKEARWQRGCWGIVRSGKGRLRADIGVKTVDIKVRVETTVAVELRQVAKRLGVPMAKIIREGLEARLKELQTQENAKEN